MMWILTNESIEMPMNVIELNCAIQHKMIIIPIVIEEDGFNIENAILKVKELKLKKGGIDLMKSFDVNIDAISNEMIDILKGNKVKRLKMEERETELMEVAKEIMNMI